MKKLLFIIIVVLSLCQCVSGRKDDEWCKKMNQRSADYIFNFQMSKDSVFLDTALYCTEEALNSCIKLKKLLSFRKLGILSMRHDYPQAISFIETFEDPMIKELPYYNNYLLNRFKAMSYQWEGDTLKCNTVLRTTMINIGTFISQNSKSIDYLFNTNDLNEILKNPLHFALVQYYYIKSVLYGCAKVQVELDSLQKIRGGNPALYDFITTTMNADFMDFVGY